MPQKAEESHEEYRARQQVPKPLEAPGVLPGDTPDPEPTVKERLAHIEALVARIIDACCKHHSGLCRDLEGPKTEGEH